MKSKIMPTIPAAKNLAAFSLFLCLVIFAMLPREVGSKKEENIFMLSRHYQEVCTVRNKNDNEDREDQITTWLY